MSYVKHEKVFLSYIQKTNPQSGKERGVRSILNIFRGDKMSDERFFAVYYISS